MHRAQRFAAIAAPIFAWLVAALMILSLAAVATGYRPRISLLPAPTFAKERLIAMTFDDWGGPIPGGGQSAIVFNDGSGYSLRSVSYDRNEITAFYLGKAELAGLMEAFRANDFATIDELMEAPGYDGSRLTLSYIEYGASHRSSTYMVEHPQFDAIARHFDLLLRRPRRPSLTAGQFVERAIAHLNALPAGSEARAAIGALYDDWLNRFSLRPALTPEQLAAWAAVRDQR